MMEQEELERFLEEMTIQSGKEISRIREDAAQRIRERTGEMEEELAGFLSGLDEREEKRIRDGLERERNRWTLEYRRMSLDALERFYMNRCLSAVESFRSSGRYIEWLLETLSGIIDETGPVEITLVMSAGDGEFRDRMARVYTQRGGTVEGIDITEGEWDIPGGFRVICPSLAMSYDSTLYSLLRAEGEDLRPEIRDLVMSGGMMKMLEEA